MVIKGEYRLLLFWPSAKLKIFYGSLKCLITHDQMRLEISKALHLLQFSSDITQTI